MDFKCSMTGATVKPEVLAAPLCRHRRMQLRKALHMQLIDERIAPGIGGRPIAAPIEGAVDHPRAQRPRERESSRAYGSIKAAVAIEAMALLAAHSARGHRSA